MSERIDIVFDGPPGPEAGRFVEVENDKGESIRFGHWVKREDGFWALRVHGTFDQPHCHVAGTTIGKDIDECAVCGRDLRHEIHHKEIQR